MAGAATRPFFFSRKLQACTGDTEFMTLAAQLVTPVRRSHETNNLGIHMQVFEGFKLDREMESNGIQPQILQLIKMLIQSSRFEKVLNMKGKSKHKW